MRCRTASKPCLELYTSPSGSPSGWPSCAAPSSHAAATPTSTSGHGWLSPFQWPVVVGEAMDSSDGLIEAAEATGNPSWLAWALAAYGVAFRDADPVGALNALGRGLVIAQDSGNRSRASALAALLARLEAEHGDPVSAFDHLTLAIRNFHNAGNTITIRVPLAVLAALFDRLGRYEPAATIAGFALSPIAAAGVPEITTAIAHLRDVLGDRPTNRSPARVRR